jgi:hypothetical protein
VLGTRLSPEQPLAQLVPEAPTVHLPAPSHLPLLPQIGLAGSSGQPPPGGDMPAVTFEQVPDAQVLHPEQVETLQHTPSTQNCGLGVCLQSATSSHGPPGPDCPHLPLWQVLGEMHCESRLQPDRHWGRVGSHMMPGQAVMAPVTQVPLPSQVDMAVTTPLLQWASAQRVPGRCLRQPPLPLQVPSLPHPETGSSLQVPVGSSPPGGTDRQIPGDPGRLQAWQTPLQAPLQQTPWAQ